MSYDFNLSYKKGSHLYSRHVCLHFSQRKNWVGGSSALLVCCIHQYALPYSHFGHSLSVSGSRVVSFSITTTPLWLIFSSTIFMPLISFFISFPQCLHLTYEVFPFFIGTMMEPHFSQNSMEDFFSLLSFSCLPVFFWTFFGFLCGFFFAMLLSSYANILGIFI